MAALILRSPAGRFSARAAKVRWETVRNHFWRHAKQSGVSLEPVDQRASFAPPRPVYPREQKAKSHTGKNETVLWTRADSSRSTEFSVGSSTCRHAGEARPEERRRTTAYSRKRFSGELGRARRGGAFQRNSATETACSSSSSSGERRHFRHHFHGLVRILRPCMGHSRIFRLYSTPLADTRLPLGISSIFRTCSAAISK